MLAGCAATGSVNSRTSLPVQYWLDERKETSIRSQQGIASYHRRKRSRRRLLGTGIALSIKTYSQRHIFIRNSVRKQRIILCPNAKYRRDMYM